jgi:hypothetical protein
MSVNIYQPARSVTQSGKGNNKWILEFENEMPKTISPLMGWKGSDDMKEEIKLTFSSKENAIKFAEKNNLDYKVYEPQARKLIIRSYSDNFK